MKNERLETTPEGFRKLDHDVIFIAGSQDVKPLRSDVERAITNTIHRLAPNSELRSYSWDIETSDSGFDQTKTMQKSLPRPGDEHCRGVICIMAERIGHPLAGVDLNLIPGVEAWTNPDHNYRLMHPWPEELEDQRRCVEEGCYPLTGTVFEFLDGYSTKTDQNVRFCLLADRQIEPGNFESVKLGGHRLKVEKARSLSNPEFTKWVNDDYDLQTTAVKNFVCALVKKGIDQNQFQDREEVITNVQQFLVAKILKVGSHNINPYRFLAYFDVFHADNFYGREKQIKRAHGDLWDRFSSPRERNVIRITGQSGAGKSSFLRAGLLARLQKVDERGDVRIVVFRPTDFQRTDGNHVEIIRSILEFVEQQTDIRLPPDRRRDAGKAGPRAAQLAIDLLQSLLPKATNGRTSKLVFGVDQFEDIVDYLSDERQQAQWFPLIEFIDAAGKSESIGIAYTVEISREKSLSELPVPDVFRERDDVVIDGFSSDFIHSIIEEPFKNAGYPLCREVVKQIEDNANELTNSDTSSTEQSILPLIALRLSKLFDYLESRRSPISKSDLAGTSVPAFDEKKASCIQLDDVKDQLDFKSLIEEEAKRAWQESTERSTVDPEDLDYFLQPLIGIGGPQLANLQLQTISARPYRKERSLDKCFERRRLLVRSPRGLRLVHQAVILFWSDAKSWFEKKQGFLKKLSLFRNKATEWNERGREDDRAAVTEEVIDTAAEILTAYMRDWALRQANSGSLSDADTLLRDYCLSVFNLSQTPAKPIQYMGKEKAQHCHLAAMYGMIELLKAFRKIDAECLERPNEKGRTALYYAAWAQPDTVEYLINVGVTPTHDKAGWPPIEASIQMGRDDIFYQLVKITKGNGFNGPEGSNMLHQCAAYGRISMATHLINYEGLEPDQADEKGRTPLHYAAGTGQLDAFGYFANASNIAAVNIEQWTALHLAALRGHISIIDFLLKAPSFRKHLGDKNKQDQTALHLACRHGHAEAVRMLLQGLDPNEKGAQNESPLHAALGNVAARSRWGRPRSYPVDTTVDTDAVFATVCALLEDPRTDPNAKDNDGNTPTALASSVSKIQRVLLRHARLDPNQAISNNREFPVSVAAKLGEWEAFRSWDERGIKLVNGPIDSSENTLLHLLIDEHAPADLLEKNLEEVTAADLNALNSAGQTPLMLAIAKKEWALVRRLLVAPDINPSIRGEMAKSALILALENGADQDTLDQLLAVNPSLLTARDYFGWTPLHQAVAYQQLEWIDWLVQQAEDPAVLWRQVDQVGRRPADLASPLIKENLSINEPTNPWPNAKSWDSELKWKLVKEESRALLLQMIPAVSEFDFENAEVDTAALSFYNARSVQIVRIASATSIPSDLHLYYLKHKGDIYRLAGQSPPIHEINARARIKLNADNVLDYLRFFCFFVRAEGGPFLIAEGATQKEIPASLMDSGGDLLKVLRPASFNGFNTDQGRFLAMASVYYGDAIFLAEFAIAPTGMIEMLRDHPVMSNLNVRVSQPIC